MALLDKSNMPEVGQHIRSLKDITVLQLTLNPSYKPSGKADAYNDVQAAQYVCPVTGLEMSGRYRWVGRGGRGRGRGERGRMEEGVEGMERVKRGGGRQRNGRRMEVL